MTKVRQSNIELLRIIAMLLVLIVHADFASIGCPNIDAIATSPLSSFFRFLAQSFSIVCVNLFVLISGYFGINPKRRSISSLIFQIIFLRVITAFIIMWIEGSQISRSTFLNLIPGYHDWFVMSYLLLVFFCPLINSFIKNSSQKQLLSYIIIFYTIQTFLGWILPIWGTIFSNGYSFTSMIGLYLLGRYLNIQKGVFQQYSTKFYIWGYLLTSLLMAIIVFFAISITNNALFFDYIKTLFGSYISPFVIFSSVCLFLAILKLNFKSRVVNWFSASVFSVYLIHCNPFTFSYYKQFCSFLFEQYNTIQYLILITLFIISVFIVAIILDKIRIIGWKYVVKLIQHKFPNF